MRIRIRKTIIVVCSILLALIVFLWIKSRTTFLYVTNMTESTYCFYFQDEFKTVIPKKTTVKLKLKKTSSAKLGVSKKIGGMVEEEFTANIGGKNMVYNIMGVNNPEPKSESSDAGSIIRISGELPENAVPKINLDNLHRIMMDKIPDRLESLRRFSPTDGIKIAGDIEDHTSEKWLTAILKLPQHRASWAEALRSIGKLKSNNAVRILKSYFKHEDIDIILAALDGFTYLENPQSNLSLIELYRETDNNPVKTEILRKLLKLPLTFDTRAFVMRELKQENPENLSLILDIVEQKKISKAIPRLKEILKSDIKLKNAKHLKIKIRDLIDNSETWERKNENSKNNNSDG